MNQVIVISSGVGPVEAREFVARLARWMTRRCDREGLPIVADTRRGPPGAPYSVRLEVHGDALALLGKEIGTHAIVVRSSLRCRRARKRWFSSVSIFPVEECKLRAAPVLRPSDLEMTAVRSGGPGGQHVNRTASAVRLRHRPSGITVRVESERSQRMNRRTAEKMIRNALGRLAEERAAAERSGQRQHHHQLERGAPVRVHALNRKGELEDSDE